MRKNWRGYYKIKEEDPKEIEAYLNTFTIQRDGAEYVTELKKDGNTIDVDAFVQAFELPSPCFFLKEMDGHIRIVIKGWWSWLRTQSVRCRGYGKK